VDDENIIIEVAGEMLAGLGYQILIADCGEKAIEIYKENKDRIDLVIMDMIMPTMGGGETF
jgi:two-component system cell cycle sensor histidine kinase/response regulator CckA